MAVNFNAGTASIKISPDLTGFHRKVKMTLRAERVEAPVVIVPDMSRFKQELTAKLSNVTAKIKVEVAPDLTNFSQQLRTRLGAINANLRVRVTPDFSGFAAELHTHLGASVANISIPVDLDFTRAREQLLLFRLEASHAMRADFDLDITAALAQLAALHAASQGIGNSAGISSIGTAAAGILNPVGLAIAALVALGAVSLIPLIGQLAQAAGVIALLPAMGAAAAASLATVLIGSTGIFDAFSKGSKAAEEAAKNAAKTAKQQATEARERASAAKAVASAQRGVEKAADGVARAERGVGTALDNVERAERGVVQAQKKSEDAQKSLTRARKDAQEQIEDLNLALKGSALDERGAELAVRRAEQQLRDLWKGGQPVTQLDIAEAVLGVDEAKQRLDEVRERNGDLREEVAAANQAGVEGSEQVISAKEAIADADQGVIDSQKSLADSHLAVADAQGAVLDAQRNFTDAQEAVIEAQVRASEVTSANADAVDEYAAALANLSPNARDFVEQTRGLAGAWKDLRLSVQDALFDGMGEKLSQLGGTYMPILTEGLTSLADVLNNKLKSAMDWLMTDDVKSDISQILTNTATALGPLLDGVGNLGRALMDLAAVGSDFMPSITGAFEEGTGSFADMIHEMRTTIDDNGKSQLHNFMQESIDTFAQIWRIIKNIGGIAKGMFAGSDDVGESWLDSIENATKKWSDFFGKPEGQKELKDFFQGVKDIVQGIVDALKLAKSIIANTPGLKLGNPTPSETNTDGTVVTDPTTGQAKTGPDDRNWFERATTDAVYDAPDTVTLDNGLVLTKQPNGLTGTNYSGNDGRTYTEQGKLLDHGGAVAEGSVGDKVADFFVGSGNHEGSTGFVGDMWNVDSWKERFTSARESWDEFTGAVGGKVEDVKTWFGDVGTRITEIGTSAVTGLRDGAKAKWDELCSRVSDGWNNTIRPTWETLRTEGLGGLANDFLTKITNGAVTDWKNLPSAIGAGVADIIGNHFPGFRGALDDLKGFFGGIVDSIGGIWDGLKAKVADPINWIIDNVINGSLKNAWNAVAKVIPGLDEWGGVSRIEISGAAKSEGGPNLVQRYATGGHVRGRGGPTDDLIDARLSNGEYVMRASAVDKIGVANLDRLNNNPLIAKGKVLAEGMFTGIRMKVGGSVDEAVARAKGFMQHESGKPYQYGGTGNPSWDCSGLWSGIVNELSGRPATSGRLFNTESDFESMGWKPGLDGRVTIGIMRGGGGENSHMAGTIDGTNAESSGDNGVQWGGPARGSDNSMFGLQYTLQELAGQFASGGQGGGGLFASAANAARRLAASTFDKTVTGIGAGIPDFGPSLVGQLPKAAFNAIKDALTAAIRGSMSSGSGSGSFEPGAGAEQWRQMMIDAYKNQGYDPTPAKIDAWMRQVDTESGGDKDIAQQIVDVNGTGEAAGVGLGQMIPETWQAYRDPALPDDRRNAWAMLNAMVRYGEQKYGDSLLDVIGQGHGYALGGIIPGYSPGQDKFQVGVSGGESIMRPEWTRAVGSSFVDGMNSIARKQGVEGVQRAMGMFAQGGVFDPEEARLFAEGRFAQFGTQVGDIAKSAIPEILGVQGTPLDPNHRYWQAAMDINAAVQGAQAAAPVVSDQAGSNSIQSAISEGGRVIEEHIHYHVADINEAIQKERVRQQQRTASFTGR